MSSSRYRRVLDREIARLDPGFRLELDTQRQEGEDRHAASEREDLALALQADVCSMRLRREEAAK